MEKFKDHRSWPSQENFYSTISFGNKRIYPEPQFFRRGIILVEVEKYIILQILTMKQIAAILLLGIFSFNIFGYRLVANYFEQQGNAQMEAALDENQYRDDQLISIKQPTNLPYYNNSASFQRINGEIEIEGVHYKYVKVRIYNDSLELMCIPNTGKMSIEAAKADFSRLAADFQQSNSAEKKSNSDSKNFQKSLSEFEEIQLTGNTAIIQQIHPSFIAFNNLFVKDLFLKTPEHPPDALSFLS